MIKSLKAFVGNESGTTAIEYALIASLIAVALVGILTSLGTRLSSEFSEISTALKLAALDVEQLSVIAGQAQLRRLFRVRSRSRDG